MRSTSISNRWTKRPIVMLLVVFVWSGFIASAVVSSDDVDVDIEEETDPDYVLIRPYSISEVGVPQNLAKVFGESDDDDVHNFSLDVMENKILETETYFQTQVRNVLSPDQVRRCQDYHERCLVWTLQGGCEKEDEFMEKNCAASCQVCNTVLPDEDLCYYLENGPDVWQPGDLDRMFRRIVQQIQDLGNNQGQVVILSSPDSTNITTEEGDTEPGPWILVIDNFLSVEEMERLIELGKIEGYQRSILQKADAEEKSYRTSRNSWCFHDGCGQDPMAKTVLQRIYDLTEIPEDYSEDMQMLYYQPGQYYKVHHDYLELDEETTKQEGNRILTVFLYLNDVEEGGETTFPELNVTVVPKPGRALIWPSVLDSDPYEIDWNTEHEANQVIRGEKYGANVWFRLKPIRKEYSKIHCCKRKRTYLENGPDAWEPGDLDSTFERIVQDPYYKTTYNLQLLSVPQSYQNHGDDTTIAGPWVITLDDFVTPEEASRLVELGALEGYVQSTLESDAEEDDEENDDEWRTPMVSWCEKKCMKDSLVTNLFARIYNLTQFDSDYTEKMQLLKYDVGQFHTARTDYNMDLDKETENQLGNRTLTFFLYLSDVDAGGQTFFPELNLQVAPKLGRVLIWPSVLNDDPAEMDSLTMHESLPVVQGTKFGANVWFRLKPFSTAYKRFTCDDGDDLDERYDGVVDEEDEKKHVDGFEDEF
ncbi:2-oxyglutarate/Fe(II) oxygenase [Nitzschia inconspicua]|uniref:2-oxyglutarate/Fe(II) oxygenase n=1 Tax=Nitzschia inconspicua TaxID=303405 RepID=A0A9K3LZS3_9STRA|nr:2-oxyglutarate/Fe(II) oxygenase [Nitzschia inconspicua]